MDEKELEKLRISALLHDVGKIAIDDAILKKPAALTDEEYEIMKQHPQRGYKIMSQIPAMKDFLPGMYMHHEMVNGQGYPQGLKGHQIPLQAKIISVADTFDAMTTDRPYQKGMKLAEALDRVRIFCRDALRRRSGRSIDRSLRMRADHVPIRLRGKLPTPKDNCPPKPLLGGRNLTSLIGANLWNDKKPGKWKSPAISTKPILPD